MMTGLGSLEICVGDLGRALCLKVNDGFWMCQAGGCRDCLGFLLSITVLVVLGYEACYYWILRVLGCETVVA